MSDNVIIALIVALPSIIAAVTAFLARRDAAKARAAAELARLDIQGVHKEVNSRFAELLAVSKAASRAEGVAEGKASREP